MFPITNTNRNSYYSIVCLDAATNFVEDDTGGTPGLGRVVEVTYMLSSNNFAYNNRDFTPPNRNGTAFLDSITSIENVDAVQVAISPSGFPARVIVIYSSREGRVSAEPDVLHAITRGAMGLGTDWVHITRLVHVDDNSPL